MFSRSGVLSIAFVFAITFLIAGVVQAQDTIVVDFEDGDLDDWEIIDEAPHNLGDAGPSTWEVRDSMQGFDGKALYQGSNIWGSAGDTCLMGTFIIYKGLKVTNFTLDVDVNAADNDGMGLVWAYEDTSKHYRVIMCNDGWPAPALDGFSGPFIKMSKRISDDEPWYELMEVEPGVIYSEGALLHWTLEVMDGAFTFTLDDEVQGESFIETNDAGYKEGYVGIQLYAQQVEFDNFTITSADAVEPAEKMAVAWGDIKEDF